MVTKKDARDFSLEREISRLLVEWYTVNQRPLPWRRTGDPYKVWASEIILQQTRVDQGTAYYLRFVERFPNLAALAEADIDDVLREWQGLGYYSRARNFHKAARHIQTELQGVLPAKYSDWIKLPGVGSYTAAAISSIAWGERQAVVDGNVIRLLSRLYDYDQAVGGSLAQTFFKEKAQQLVETQDPGTINQAMMEFGSLRCKPVNPLCEDCVLGQLCVSRARGSQNERPVKQAKRKPGSETWRYAVVYDQNGAVFVRRRPAKGIWGGLYEFPLLDEWPLSNAIEAEPIRLEHRLSHLKLELEFRFFELEPHLEYRLGAPFRLIDREEREMLGFPRPFLSVFELLDRRLGAL